MQTSSLNQIKKELEHLSDTDLQKLCLSLARYKKENKELLNYLLFEAHDEIAFIEKVKAEMISNWQAVNVSNWHLAKKSIRKIVNQTKKHIRFSGKKETEIELLLFFCQQMQQWEMNFAANKVLVNMYNSQLKSIQKSLGTLHEDLQYDYQVRVDELTF